MNFYIVIPAHNEEAYIGQTLQSLVEQTMIPKRVMVVDDHSTDGTSAILKKFSDQYSFISYITISSERSHAPGSKVINAFYQGLSNLDDAFDVICKFDADLIFPKNYIEKTTHLFELDEKVGIAGGFCHIERNGRWELENLTNKDHIRGALKAYRKACFQDIGGLKRSMGWDTVDELLAQYNGWEIATDTSLHVKHLKPTGSTYGKNAKLKQGQAFKKMRYGFILTLIAAAKLAVKKKNSLFFIHCIQGYYSEIDHFLVTKQEGQFIRNLRWRNIRKKLF